MKRLLFETKVSGKYVLVVILLTLIMLGVCFSYAMFTVEKTKGDAITLKAGTLAYTLLVDGVETNELVVASNTTHEFAIDLSNPNDRMARFNFYYLNPLPFDVIAGYVFDNEIDIPPVAIGINLESGVSQRYTIRVINNSDSSITIPLGVSVGLHYNDLTLTENAYLFDDLTVSTVLLRGVGENGAINTSDPEQTFITGVEPDNYIWYSGKLWRAVSIDPSDNSVKLVTEWNVSAIPYHRENSTAFEGSYMEEWLNDTSCDGFLGNLRDYENFIKMDSVWNATLTISTDKPEKTTMVEDVVGLLNIYEYSMSYSGTDYSNGYLNNGLYSWTLTPYNTISRVYYLNRSGNVSQWSNPILANGVRPSINLKSEIEIASGAGTENNPYRLVGDYDINLSGTLLNTRYSGEYLTFGTGENNLYRIVSHEMSGLTKITSSEPLKSGGEFITSSFGADVNYSSTNTIGSFLNGEYLTNYVGNDYANMIEENTAWYLGMVGDGASYRLAKYSSEIGSDFTTSTTIASVGLLRLGELMAGQFDRYENNMLYWTLTPHSIPTMRIVHYGSDLYHFDLFLEYGIRPALHLKQNVIITEGTGTREAPFQIALE